MKIFKTSLIFSLLIGLFSVNALAVDKLCALTFENPLPQPIIFKLGPLPVSIPALNLQTPSINLEAGAKTSVTLGALSALPTSGMDIPLVINGKTMTYHLDNNCRLMASPEAPEAKALKVGSTITG